MAIYDHLDVTMPIARTAFHTKHEQTSFLLKGNTRFVVIAEVAVDQFNPELLRRGTQNKLGLLDLSRGVMLPFIRNDDVRERLLLDYLAQEASAPNDSMLWWMHEQRGKYIADDYATDPLPDRELRGCVMMVMHTSDAYTLSELAGKIARHYVQRAGGDVSIKPALLHRYDQCTDVVFVRDGQAVVENFDDPIDAQVFVDAHRQDVALMQQIILAGI